MTDRAEAGSMITTAWPDPADDPAYLAWLDAWDAETAEDEATAMADLIAAKTTEDVRRIDAILGQIMEAQAEAKAARRRWCSETGHNWPELVPLRAAPVAVARRAPARPRGRGRAPGRPAVRSGSRSNSDGAAPDPAGAAAGSVAECLLPPAVAAEVQRIFDGIARRVLDERIAAAGLR